MNQETRTRPIPVLFIAGAGRSGSTFLDTVLGNHPDVGSYGELYRLPRDGWLRNGPCACGESADRCPFWSEVRRVWLGSSGDDALETYIALDVRFRRMRSWNLRRELGRPSRAFRGYAERTSALFRAVLDVSGKTWIVDSSKHGARGVILSRTPEIDLSVVHLVRDARGVLWSFRKVYEPVAGQGELARGASLRLDGGGRPLPALTTWRAARKWIRRNVAAEWIRRRVAPDRSIRVRYEDLVARPVEILGEIGRLMDLEMGDLGEKVARGEDLEVGHTIAGNRLRMDGRVRLRPDTAWRERMPAGDRRLFWLLTGWLMKSYGYRR